MYSNNYMVICYLPFVCLIESLWTLHKGLENRMAIFLYYSYSWIRLSIHFCIAGIFVSFEWQFLRQKSRHCFLNERKLKRFLLSAGKAIFLIGHRSYIHNLRSCEIKAWKNSGLNGIRACNTGAALYQLSCEVNWELVTLSARDIYP